MRLALAQINTVVGDLDRNRDRIVARIREAKEEGADLVLFPELAVTGYPPEDLLLRPGFVRAAERALEEIARATRNIVALVGVPILERDLYNACAVCTAGEVKALYRKRFLPNYGVFDEDRYFAPGHDLVLLEHGGTLIGPTVCEDLWQPGPPATDLALAGAQLLVNLSASPFHVGKEREREEMLIVRARALARASAELPVARVVELSGAPAPGRPIEPALAPLENDLESMRLALALGLRDYVAKKGFRD